MDSIAADIKQLLQGQEAQKSEIKQLLERVNNIESKEKEEKIKSKPSGQDLMASAGVPVPTRSLRLLSMDSARAERIVADSGVDLNALQKLLSHPEGRDACRALMVADRVCWLDGVFDLTHYGHFISFLQARKLGDKLVVGVNSDASVKKIKGSSPIIAECDRITMLKACKFVDHVEEEVPYLIENHMWDEYIEKHGLCCAIHGNDPCYTQDGEDVYAYMKQRGMYQEIQRQPGVSSTELIGRLLSYIRQDVPKGTPMLSSEIPVGDWKFAATARVFTEFLKYMTPNDKGLPCVYVDGSWDLLHAGHVRTLQKIRAQAKEDLGEEPFLIVGVHSDDAVRQKWPNRPIMNVNERYLSVMALRDVDEAVMNAPWEVTEEFMMQLNVRSVYHALNPLGGDFSEERHKNIKEKGKFKAVERSADELSIEKIIEKVKANPDEYHRQHSKKSLTEDANNRRAFCK